MGNYKPGSPGADANYIRRKHRREQNRKKAIAHLGGRCVRCGARKKLDFDHIDPATKRINISEILDCTWERILIELGKCQLLCGNGKCHTDKTYENGDAKGARADHGGLAMYRHHKCRCSDCRAAANEYARVYWNKNKARLNAERNARRTRGRAVDRT